MMQKSRLWQIGLLLLIVLPLCIIAFWIVRSANAKVSVVNRMDMPIRWAPVRIAVSADSRSTLLTVPKHCVWVATLSPRVTFSTFDGDFFSAAFDEDSVFAVGSDGLTTFDIHSAKQKHNLFIPAVANGIARLADGDLLVSSSSQSDLTTKGGLYWITSSPDLNLTALRDDCGCSSVSYAGKWASTVCGEGQIVVFDETMKKNASGTWEAFLEWTSESFPGGQSCIGQSGRNLLVKDFRGLNAFEIHGRSLRLKYSLAIPLVGKTGLLQETSISADEEFGVTISNGGVILFDLASGLELWRSNVVTSAVAFVDSAIAVGHTHVFAAAESSQLVFYSIRNEIP